MRIFVSHKFADLLTPCCHALSLPHSLSFRPLSPPLSVSDGLKGRTKLKGDSKECIFLSQNSRRNKDGWLFFFLKKKRMMKGTCFTFIIFPWLGKNHHLFPHLACSSMINCCSSSVILPLRTSGLK